jgi:hypothetical protein
MRLGFGLGLQYSKLSGGGSGFDSDYQAVLDFATSEGITLPSTSQQILQNNVVLGFKDKNLWNKKDAFGLFATDGNVDFALICWKRLIKMDAINSPSFSANAGFTGDGVSSYIDTKFKPLSDGINYTLDNAGLSINVGSGSGYIVGNISTASGNQRIRIGNDLMINGDTVFLPTAFQAGNIHLDRLSSTQIVSQQDSTIEDTKTNNSTSLQNNEIFLLRITNNYSNANIKAFSARASFTETEKNDYDTIINTYLAAL